MPFSFLLYAELFALISELPIDGVARPEKAARFIVRRSIAYASACRARTSLNGSEVTSSSQTWAPDTPFGARNAVLLEVTAWTSVGRHLPDHVEVPGPEVGHHRRRIGLPDELDPLQARAAAEVMLVGHERQRLIRDERRDLVRPRPVPALGEVGDVVGVAHLDVDERVREDRARAAELDPDLVRVDHAHGADVLRVRTLLRRHRWIEHAQNVRPHVVGRERPAGRILHALAEGEEPGLQILRRAPLGRQVGHDVHVAVVLRETVVEQRLQRHLTGEGERVRVELVMPAPAMPYFSVPFDDVQPVAAEMA